ncbi:nuclear transport factor 2 family protein [Nocardia sp. NBC_00511]|uniref:nuclear transport factor 2 family protein n=1 Tax=Nocardia sp. NBC_00511 TaxID=2903591 RepID=UPI0030E2BB03
MALTDRDRIQITDLVNLHGHLTDSGDLDRMAELFTPDVTYDLTDFGLDSLHGPTAIREAALALGDANPVGHHVTNIVITEIDDRSARVRSKGIGIKADGSTGSVVYDDTVTRGPDDWKIHYRKVSARRAPLGSSHPTPRDVLERWRRAAIDRSADAMRKLYAPTAIHEFPFALPGVRSRLTGREGIVAWIAASWAATDVKYKSYRTLSVHATTDPDTIIVEQEAIGTSATTGDFTLPNLLILTTHNGEIIHLRDYIDTAAAAVALGHLHSTTPDRKQ